ncbi:MAG TPA: LysM peptidoglycan-binding domain-containing protein [Dehalococcoidia bacterium]|nr:LysM peptidoglycan-binding domain-containing protein [Dehalococcoidia bacterium]
MDCYSCNEPAINACKRCAKPYCEDHGNATYCADCLRPSSALPSFNLYRGALLVMLVGTAVAVLLILRPPGESNGAAPVVVGRSTPTATAASGTPQPTVAAATPGATGTAAGGTPGANQTPAAGSATPNATTSVATPGATVSPFNVHVVVAGDTLFGIAQANLAPGDDLVAFARAIATLNGIDYNNPNLAIGQQILLPKPKPQ